MSPIGITSSHRSNRVTNFEPPSPTLVTNNSYVLKEEQRLEELQRTREPRMTRSGRHSRDPRSSRIPSNRSVNQTESYYTIYRDPTGNSTRENQSKYFDERGRAIEAVDLLFDSPDKHHGGSRLFKKFGKSKAQLPCIGAKELAYHKKQDTRDMQLNAMPSLTNLQSGSYTYNRQLEDAVVDSAFENMRYDPNTGTYRRLQPHLDEPDYSSSTSSSRVASKCPSRELSSISLNEKALENLETQEEVPPVTPFSLWDCLTYVASFIPAVPILEAPINIEESAVVETAAPVENEADMTKGAALERPFEYKKELPPIPRDKKTSKVRKAREKKREFLDLEFADKQVVTRKVSGRHGDDSYNRSFHPKFNQKFNQKFSHNMTEKTSGKNGFGF